jgi:hypothetical protein
MLDWCADQGYPEPEGIQRHRVLAENKMISQGAPGLNAPMAIPRDGAMFLLATIVTPSIKKTPKEVAKFGAFPLVRVQPDPPSKGKFGIALGTPLLDVLTEALEQCGPHTECLEQCGSHWDLRMVSLEADRDANPAVYLVLGQIHRREH